MALASSFCLRSPPISLQIQNTATASKIRRGSVNSQIASTAFTLGTVAVLPFFILMVLAPKAELTRRSMQSNVPYVVLGFMYAYLMYLSWMPETTRLIFAGKNWLAVF